MCLLFSFAVLFFCCLISVASGAQKDLCRGNDEKSDVQNLSKGTHKWTAKSPGKCITLEDIRITPWAQTVKYPKFEEELTFDSLAYGFSKLTDNDLALLKKRKNPVLSTMYILEKLKQCDNYDELENKFINLLQANNIVKNC